MKKIILLFFSLIGFSILFTNAQSISNDSWKKTFRATSEKTNDMVHVKLEARFDYPKSQMNGKVWITLKPHFYPTDSAQLDAKGMDIHKILLVDKDKNTPLQYSYDSLNLNIRLGRTFTSKNNYTLYIEYTAKPNQLKTKGSAAINSAKGLYFIDPMDTNKEKPTQIWTQGETESNSAWIPIIDKPNQKSTQEMILIVPDKYVSLSNGKLVKQVKNNDGTRTDTWIMDQAHAPYLFFMGIGDYAVVKDTYKGKEVSYYVEKPYKDVARKIFGDTPEMIRFYSEKLGVEYPWVKYAQMTARDYVSGAMENTTATLHGVWAQQNARELTDGNKWETTIAHELFHQWFGDYVTCESWSNLTVNESFADFSEGMWQEHKYGKDESEAYYYQLRRNYLNNKQDTAKKLVRYYYADKEEMFDLVSYQKGGAILNMLKAFIGDDAFYKSLTLYLTRNSYGNGNAHKLQQAFEDVSGKDLHWFFNQWYYGAGHPNLDITYNYNENTHTTSVVVQQTQKSPLFKLPVFIDVYEGNMPTRYFRWLEHASDTLQFTTTQKPALINVDADKKLLAIKNDHKTLNEFVFQYYHAGNYVDRSEAIDFISGQTQNPAALSLLQTALKDPNYRIRLKTLYALKQTTLNSALIADIETLAKTDPKNDVKAIALSMLFTGNGDNYKDLLIKNLTDSSYTIAGTAFGILIDKDEKLALEWLPKLQSDAKGQLKTAVEKAEILTKTDKDFNELYTKFSGLGLGEKYQFLPNFLLYLKQVNDVSNFKKGVELVFDVRDQLLPYIPTFKENIANELSILKKFKTERKSQGISTAEMETQIQYLEEINK